MIPDGDQTRIAVLEQRVSQMERALDTLTETVAGQSKLLIGILVSVTTSAILLAVNVVLGALK